MLRAYRSLIIGTLTLNLLISTTLQAETCLRLEDVSGGENHTLVLMKNKTLWACGGNVHGQLGIGSHMKKHILFPVVDPNNPSGYLEDVACFDAGWYHSLAIHTDGYARSWGGDGSGQLGNGDEKGNSPVPGWVNDPNSGFLGDIVHISAGRSGEHSLAADSFGNAWAWGKNSSKQCSPIPDAEIHTPVLVNIDPNVIAVDAGVSHSLALDINGRVWHWGAYTTSSSTTPHRVAGENDIGYLENVIAISSCKHSLALDSNGNVWKWDSFTTAPVKVADGQMQTESGYLESITAIGAGSGYSLALAADGSVWAWGSICLGNNTSGSSTDPVRVHDGQMNTDSGYLESITAIDAGFTHALAVDALGRGWAWGAGSSGKLGNNNAQTFYVPQKMYCVTDHDTIYLSKTAAIENDYPSVIPGDFDRDRVTFTITAGNSVTNTADPNYVGDQYNSYLIDYLPPELYFLSAEPNTLGYYDEPNHAYVINLNPLTAGQQITLEISTLALFGHADPCSIITNTAYLITDHYLAYDTAEVPVADYGPNIIYVDQNAQGQNTGVSWGHAYLDPLDALARAQRTPANEIWIADGHYKADATHNLSSGVALYGGFSGHETQRAQRNPNLHQAILSVNNSQTDVITAQNYLGYTVIDGLTISGGQNGVYCTNTYDNQERLPLFNNCTITSNSQNGFKLHNYGDINITNCSITHTNTGIYCTSNSYPALDNCRIEYNLSYGIHFDDSYAALNQCTINYNSNHGIWADQSTIGIDDSEISYNGYGTQYNTHGIFNYDSILNLTNSLIEQNTGDGIYTYNYSSSTISNSRIRNNGTCGIYIGDNPGATELKNNLIHHNGHTEQSGSGVYFEEVDQQTSLLRNNTIVYNYDYGVDSADIRTPDIYNCIIHGNDYAQLGDNCLADYSCIEPAPGDPNSATPDAYGNIYTDPIFAYSDPSFYNFHLDLNSPCIDLGDPLGDYAGETDIDGDDRVYDSYADIGADEFACTDIYNPVDFNADGIVNLTDYSQFANVWMYDTSDPNWSPVYDLHPDSQIDLVDLHAFNDNYLWFACWNHTDFQPGASRCSSSPPAFTSRSSFSALSESSFSTNLSLETLPSLNSTEPTSTYNPQQFQMPLEYQIAQAKENITWAENLWDTEPEIENHITKTEWEEFIDILYEYLDQLQNLQK
ncbi:MAG: right-handed parallel beta-helix repeat-containing protein [Phycisphaerae bacterium]|nr:right-handed parallel beta-helix repeat-containing protein [Phycisphaerae bacterium]